MNQISVKSSSGFPTFHRPPGGPRIPSGSFYSRMCSAWLAGYARRLQVLRLAEAAQLKPSWPRLAVDAFDNSDDTVLTVHGYSAWNRLRAYRTTIRARLERIEVRDAAVSEFRTRTVRGFGLCAIL